LFTVTVVQGIAPQELRVLDILEMLAWATAWLRQHAPEQATPYAHEAEQLIQDIEVGFVPPRRHLCMQLRHGQTHRLVP
jgi:hypothetical protein